MANKKVLKKIKVPLYEEEKGNKVMRAGRVDEYEVLEIEKDCVIVEMEKVVSKVSPNGSIVKSSVPTVQKFDARAWLNMRKQARKLGFNYVKVIYAPEGTPTDVLDPTKEETKKGKK